MADSVANMLVGSALQSADKTPDFSGAVESGIGLATKIQQVQQQREALEQQKQQQYVAKIEKFSSLYETASKLPPGAARNGLFKTVIPKTRDALGLQKEFPDDSMVILNANPEVVGYLKSKVEAGELTLPQLLSNMQDAQWIADNVPHALQEKAGKDLTPQVTEDMEALQKSENFRIKEANDKKNAEIVAAGQAARAIADDERQPKVEFKKKIAKDAAALEGAGGFARVDTQIEKLKKVKADLESGKLKTGAAKHLAPEGAQAYIDPEVKAAQDLVRSSIDLKKALDSSFSDAAAAQAYGQSFDRKLPNDKNVEKLEFLIKDLETQKKNQMKNFKKEGFDVGGSSPISDEHKKKFAAIKDPAMKEKAVTGLAKMLNLSIADVRKELGLK